MVRKILLRTVFGLILLAAGIFAWFHLSPWPSSMLIRIAFDRDAIAASRKLAVHVPAGILERRDVVYGEQGSHLRFDVFRPAGEAQLPVVVWVHGGAWISGNKDYIANYLRILAGKGFATVGVGYDIAPGAKYPTPVRQVNTALAYLTANAKEFGLDMKRVVLAGDSAGAQIAAQVGIVQLDRAYAARLQIVPGIEAGSLRGMLLHCGGYDIGSVDFSGAFGSFLNTVFWSYFGTRDFLTDPRMTEFSVIGNLPGNLPPLFISAGNADPLLPQSRLLAERASSLGADVEALFFAADHVPPLGHEYQFDLDYEAGLLALERGAAFLNRVLNP